MPAQTSRTSSPLVGALRANAKKKVDYGQDFASLPGGISGGLAELVRAEIGTYKKGDLTGKRYFMAMGTVLAPEKAVQTVKRFANGKIEVVSQMEVVIRGRQTKVGPLPLCDNRKGDKGKDANENAEAVVNELQKLGGEECTHMLADPSIDTDDKAIKALEAICKALVDAKPAIRFRFRTWQGDPSLAYPGDSRVNEYWMGADHSAQNGQAEHAAVQDDSGSNGQEIEAEQQSADVPAEAGDAQDAGDDLAALVASSDANDTAAQQRLIDLAVEAGVGEREEVEAIETWQGIADAIEAQASGEETTEEETVEEEIAPWAPAIGEQYDHFPTVKDAKGKAVKSKKAVKCVVHEVDEAKGTFTLKAGKTLYKGVKFAAFEPK